MAVYAGAFIAGTPYTTLPVCFTGTTAKLVRAAIITGFAYLGALVCGAIGAVLGIEGGPPGMATGALLGAIAGALAAGLVSVAIAAAGTCPCPPGCDGFCVRFLFLAIPGTTRLVPFPPFVWSDPTQCPILVPPGCP